MTSMTMTEQIITIAMVVLGTMATRFLPFLIFPAGKPTPKYIQFLGRFLPAAVFGLLVVYCLKALPDSSLPASAATLVSVAAVVVLHLWKRNTLLSIAGGTILYMALLRLI